MPFRSLLLRLGGVSLPFVIFQFAKSITYSNSSPFDYKRSGALPEGKCRLRYFLV